MAQKMASANNEQFTPNLAKNKKGRPNQDYWLSLDTAKHICLMERKNPIAHAIRQHFIDSEKELTRIAPITAKDLRQRTKLRIESIAPQERLQLAIQEWAKRNGKEDRAHHYSNEAEMINSIVLGMNARLWKKMHDISDCPRNHFNAEQLELLNSLLEADATLLNIDLAFSTRKEKLTELAARKLLARIA